MFLLRMIGALAGVIVGSVGLVMLAALLILLSPLLAVVLAIE